MDDPDSPTPTPGKNEEDMIKLSQLRSYDVDDFYIDDPDDPESLGIIFKLFQTRWNSKSIFLPC